MLTIFLKNAAEKQCKCQIIKLVDRILLGEVGEIKEKTKVSRTIVIALDSDSPIPLNEITIFTRYPISKNLVDISYTLLDPDYKLNGAGVGDFRIINVNDDLIKYDGIENIKVFRNMNISDIERIGGYNRFTIYFNEPLKAGEKLALRLHYILNNVTEGKSKYKKEVSLRYFRPVGKSIVDELLQDREREIKCLPFYKSESRLDKLEVYGGFDIMLYVPTTFNISTNPATYENPVITQTDIDGSKGIERDIYIWRLRQFIHRDGEILEKDPFSCICGYGHDINIHTRIEKTVPYETNRKQFIIFLILAIVALLRPEIIELAKYIGKTIIAILPR